VYKSWCDFESESTVTSVTIEKSTRVLPAAMKHSGKEKNIFQKFGHTQISVP
jgi:hypothetical protein